MFLNQRKIFFVIVFLVTVCLLSAKLVNTPYPFPDLPHFPKIPDLVKKSVTLEGAELGRYLFYDPILSEDSSISCSSCHKQKSAFSDSPIDFSNGINEKKMNRNTMPLFNLAWSTSFFWDGRANSIEEQISHPILNPNEMNMNWDLLLVKLNRNKFYKKKFKSVYKIQNIDSSMVIDVLGQFLKTLISYQSKYDKFVSGKIKLTKEEFNGFSLMNNQTRGDCLHCHPTDGNSLMTTYKFSNNGIDSVFDAELFIDKGRGGITKKKSDIGKFKIPSLRNIAITSPYMHDGRFKTLEEVLDFYSKGVHSTVNIDSKMEYANQGGVNLSEAEKRDIILFLKTLTDSTFIKEKKFSNPFLN